MSSDSSYKGPFECDDEEEVDKKDVEEDASSANSDEDEHTEFIESSEMDPMDVESLLHSPPPSLTTQLVSLAPTPFIIPFTFISTKICCAMSPIIC